MAKVITDKTVNLGQLAHELGRVSLRVLEDADQRRTISTDDVDEGALRAAVAAHVADAAWVDPNPPPKTQAQIDVETLRNALASGTVPEYVKAAIRHLGIRP